jgi:hypothetical protein
MSLDTCIAPGTGHTKGSPSEKQLERKLAHSNAETRSQRREGDAQHDAHRPLWPFLDCVRLGKEFAGVDLSAITLWARAGALRPADPKAACQQLARFQIIKSCRAAIAATPLTYARLASTPSCFGRWQLSSLKQQYWPPFANAGV